MKKLIFTVYMLLLFIFSATATPNRSIVKSPDKVVVVVKPANHVALAKKRVVRRQARLIRREARVERKIERTRRRRIRRCL